MRNTGAYAEMHRYKAALLGQGISIISACSGILTTALVRQVRVSPFSLTKNITKL